MISIKNIHYLEEAHYSYILGFRMRSIKKDERAAILKKVQLKELKENLSYKEIYYQDRRLVVYCNPDRADLEKKKRDEILERITKKNSSGKIDSIVENKDYKRFLKIEGKAPVIDKNKVAQDQLFDGVFILASNTQMKPGEIVQTYRSSWQCEFSFRTLKSELEMGPIYHWKNRRIRSHIFICFMALICRVMLTKKIKKLSRESSYSEVTSSLKRLRTVSLDIKSTRVVLRTEIETKAKITFRALGMAFPRRTLHYESKNHLVLRH